MRAAIRGGGSDTVDGRLAARTDSYFLKTKAIVGQFGDRAATYAVFMRRPVISRAALRGRVSRKHGGRARRQHSTSSSTTPKAPGSAPASRSSTSTGPLFHLVDLETVLLQKLGPACVAAYNA